MKVNKDIKFAFYSKYTLLAILLFVVLFSLRGSCTLEQEICAGGFPINWLFKEDNNVYASFPALLLNLIIYYIFSAIVLIVMRKYANHKNYLK
jgi:hypothetical protein